MTSCVCDVRDVSMCQCRTYETDGRVRFNFFFRVSKAKLVCFPVGNRLVFDFCGCVDPCFASDDNLEQLHLIRVGDHSSESHKHGLLIRKPRPTHTSDQ